MKTGEAQKVELERTFHAGLAAARPEAVLPGHLPARPKGRTIVVGAGKASAEMARVLEQHWDGPLEGLVVTRYGHGAACERIRIVEASHPVPDANGQAAAEEILRLAGELGNEDLLIVLISGGGSALLAAPAEGLSLADKMDLNRQLLTSGAPIGEVNTFRKCLSRTKGGRLALAAQPARVVTLAISDVPGDDPAAIASGPTVPEEVSGQRALEIAGRYGLVLPDGLRGRLQTGAMDTPRLDDYSEQMIETRIIAAPQMTLDAAAAEAARLGYIPMVLGDSIEGEARVIGQMHAALARQIVHRGQPLSGRVALISGGETSVTVRSKGRGGRNAEFLMGFALAAEGLPGVAALAADTDGIDGSEDNAGAFCLPGTLERIRARGGDPRSFLAANDCYSAFELAGDLFVTGPTRTNVNDLRVILTETAGPG